MNQQFSASSEFRKNSHIKSLIDYTQMYNWSINDPKDFWSAQAKERLSWIKQWDEIIVDKISELKEGLSGRYLSFFKEASLNVSYNCLDRHLKESPSKPAIIWQGEDYSESRILTYSQLHEQTCKLSNVLKDLGIKKGDTVTVYMPMVPEAVVAMLACARIGAIHNVVFSAFSPDSLKSRIIDCNSKLVITADAGFHGGKLIPLKDNVNKALSHCPSVKATIVLNRANQKVSMQDSRDFWWHEKISSASSDCPPVEIDAEDPLFILYTSGSTGKPKGVMHTSAGYLLYANLTFRYVFDYQPDDIFWCTADIGWITGHSYLVYGPLSNGATCLMFEGIPTYPAPTRFWEIIEKYKVNIFYTAPTAIRTLMRFGEDGIKKYDLSSLRLLGSVGEPINPEAWLWYYKHVGHSRCPIVDTWWQTETGGIMITTLPGAMSMKPGAAGLPFFGIKPKILDSKGNELPANESGSLYIDQPWPSMIRGVFGDHSNELIVRNYFSAEPEKYFTGDGCAKDEDGYYWLKGRIDDVINVSAHRFSTAELESALVSHQCVAEAAVVGFPHDTKGQGIHCFVTLKIGIESTHDLRSELVKHIRSEIGPIATPDKLQFAPSLPKTRSGKIMRRILRKIAEGAIDEIGDVSTLADPTVVESLVKCAADC